MNRKRIRMSILAALIVLFVLWTVWSNFSIGTTVISAEFEDLPDAFDGFRIAQISDLHDAEHGENHSRLLKALKAAQPDMIVLTGDMVDSKRTDIAQTLVFANSAAEIAPTYYVNGNHEAIISEQDYKALTDGLRACGVTVLEDECIDIERDEASISLIGLNDIGHLNVSGVDAKIAAMQKMLENLLEGKKFSVVLSHRPELMDAYAATAADIVFSGHAHGGQFRLPVIGGLIAPGQGMLPEYDSGLYQKNDTTMIVSRGIGNSVIPIRFNNRPEIIIAELHTQ